MIQETHSAFPQFADKELDYGVVVPRGRAFPQSSLVSRLRCPRCGNWRMVVMFEPRAQTVASGRRPLR